MKSISQTELARLQSRGARVVPMPQRQAPEPPAPAPAAALAGVFDNLSALLREGAKREDIDKRAESLEDQIARMREEMEAEIAALRAGAVAAEETIQALGAEMPRVAERAARKAVAAQPQPVPEVKEVHHHPVIETREVVQPVHTVETRVVERVVEEKMLEADQLSSITVQRDRFGRIAAITRAGVQYVVTRDKDGFITRVDPK